MPPRTLTTERLELHPWSEGHTELLARLAANPAVTRYVGDGRPWPRERAVERSASVAAHWREHGFGWRAAVARADGREVGLIALNLAGEGAGIPPEEYEIGWWIEPAHWGQGLAREGALAVRDEAFTRIGAPSIVARVRPANGASLAVAHALGLTEEAAGVGRFGEGFVLLRLRRRRWRALRNP